MEKKYVSLVFDRRHTSERTGFGKVEILVLLTRKIKKYIPVKDCSIFEWKRFQNDKELLTKARIYNEIVLRMVRDREDLTIDNFNEHIGYVSKKKSASDNELIQKKRYLQSRTGLIDFIQDSMKTEELSESTLKRRKVVIDSLKTYGLTAISQLTPEKLKKYDYYLRKGEGVRREAPAVNNYHKTLKKYVRILFSLRYIEYNPYDNPICHFDRGKCKERKPLNEEELQKLINLQLTCDKEIKARDLFIFSAYTGLAYIDAQNFDFETMTEDIDGTYYIDGERVKTGSNFFTPILPPAMAVLEKYNYHLPKLSNQKMNDYLHLIETKAEIKKPMTSHVARHSFATLLLSKDIPIENVARMMGHQDIKTTQIYAKVLKETIERHTKTLISKLSVSSTPSTPTITPSATPKSKTVQTKSVQPTYTTYTTYTITQQITTPINKPIPTEQEKTEDFDIIIYG